MLKNKGKNKAIILTLAAALLTVGFTSQAAALQSDYTADVQASEMQKHDLVNTVLTNTVTVSSIEKAKEAIADNVEEAIRAKEEEQRQAEEAALAQQQQYNLELLASIIFCEAGNQPYEGQVAVGAVVMNRINSASYPNSIEEVIYQSGQFTPAMTGWLDSVRASSGYTETAMQAAKDALAGANPVGGCLYFDQGGYGMKIGAHYFH